MLDIQETIPHEAGGDGQESIDDAMDSDLDAGLSDEDDDGD